MCLLILYMLRSEAPKVLVKICLHLIIFKLNTYNSVFKRIEITDKFLAYVTQKIQLNMPLYSSPVFEKLEIEVILYILLLAVCGSILDDVLTVVHRGNLLGGGGVLRLLIISDPYEPWEPEAYALV